MTNPFSHVVGDPEAEHELVPEEGGAQSGTQINESDIDEPGDDHSPTTDNDVT